MAEPNDLIRAREALVAPGDSLDPTLLGAVHDGLLSVPADPAPGDPRQDHGIQRPALRPRGR